MLKINTILQLQLIVEVKEKRKKQGKREKESVEKKHEKDADNYIINKIIV